MEQLSTKERRCAIAQLLEANPDTTNNQLAQRYSVSERTVTNDRAKIRHEEKAENPLADLKRAYQRNQKVVEQGKTEVRQGTKLFLDHCIAGAKLALDYLKGLQSVGIVPNNIGAKQITRSDFVSPTPGLPNMKKANS